jgi:hypothetical protein
MAAPSLKIRTPEEAGMLCPPKTLVLFLHPTSNRVPSVFH